MKTAFGVLVLGLLLAPLQAQVETVEIKIGHSKVGGKARVTETNKEKTDSDAIVAENQQKQSDVKDHKFVYVETVLEKPDPMEKATKTSRLYETATAMRNGKAVPLSFAGKTVIVEKTAKGFTYTVDGKPLPAEEEAYVEKNANDSAKKFDAVVLPGKPVKVNDEWPIDVAKFFEGDDKMPFTVDGKKAIGKAKLTKVYRKGSQQYGVIVVTIDTPLKTVTLAQDPAPVKEGSMKMNVVMDVCIDGSPSYGTMTIAVALGFTCDLPQSGSLTVKCVVDSTKTVESVK